MISILVADMEEDRHMPLYTLMSSLRWPRSYVGRILSLCFIGTHMPLIGLVLFELLSRDKEIVQTLGVVLVATIVVRLR